MASAPSHSAERLDGIQEPVLSLKALSGLAIDDLWREAAADSVDLTKDELATVLLALGAKYNYGLAAEVKASQAQIATFWRRLQLRDLALAHACALGRDAAWERFIARITSRRGRTLPAPGALRRLLSWRCTAAGTVEKNSGDARGTVEIALNGKPAERLTLTAENGGLLHQLVLQGFDFNGPNKVAIRFKAKEAWPIRWEAATSCPGARKAWMNLFQLTFAMIEPGYPRGTSPPR